MRASEIDLLSGKFCLGTNVFSAKEARRCAGLRSGGIIGEGDVDPRFNLPSSAARSFRSRDGECYYRDPETGMRVPLARADVVVWNVSLRALLDKLRAAFGCKGDLRPLVDGRLWDLGEGEQSAGHRNRHVFFAPDLRDGTLLEGEQDGRASAIVIAGTAVGMQVPATCTRRVFALGEVVSLQEDGSMTADWDAIKLRLGDVKPEKAPPVKKQKVHENTMKIVNVLKGELAEIRRLENSDNPKDYKRAKDLRDNLSKKVIAGKAHVHQDKAYRIFTKGREIVEANVRAGRYSKPAMTCRSKLGNIDYRAVAYQLFREIKYNV